jgi:hypothetical protein
MPRKNGPISRHSDEFTALLRAARPTDYERLLMARPTRQLRGEEHALVLALANVAKTDNKLISQQALDSARVRDMPDGGMGSIRFAAPGDGTDRSFGNAAGELWYVDADGVAVTFCLNLDKQGELFEVDVWKVDFSPLKRFPQPEDLHAEPPVRGDS